MIKRSNPIGRTQWDLINQIWESAPWKILNRVATLLIIICILFFLYIQVFPVPELIDKCLYRCMSKISVTKEYALTVPANALWINSGITVHENDSIEILVSGSVNVAIHRCVENAIADVLPQNPWVNYTAVYGDQPPSLLPDKIRKYFCAIRRDVPFGILLMYIWDGKGAPPSHSNPFVDSNFVKDIMPKFIDFYLDTS
ncbi:MAG: hypothetical protein JW913_13740 [Chitinispirillaceae bacterium]|nr:hypothetical protein [Chitinispirillaceae bacterium]